MPQVIAAIGVAISSLAAGSSLATAATVATVTALGGSAFAVSAGLAVGGFVSALTFGSGIVAALNAWGTVALLASSALSPPAVGRGAAGTQVDLQADPRAGIPLCLGTTGTAGKILHANTSGATNKNVALFYLIALSGGPISRFGGMKANEFDITFSGENVIAPPQFATNAMLLRVIPGAKPEAAATYPPGVDRAWIPEWTDDHKTSGLACVWWTLVYNPKAFPTGVPRPLFIIDGPAVYDPRFDSTYPGGSGPCRWNDETTWVATGIHNPYLQALTWAIGRRDNGKLTFGVGAPIEAIDVPAFVEGANVADANNWKVGGEVLSSDRKWDVLRTILQAGGGEPVKRAGKLSVVVRTPRVSVMNLTGRDAVGEVSITGTKRRRDRFNQIIPTYRSPEHSYELVPAGAVTVDAYVTADGGLRSREGTYPLVQAPKQAAELAAYDIVDAREFEPIVMPLGPRFAALKPGDCLTIDEPEYGMAGQQVVVQTRDIDLTSGVVTLTCRSETPGKHDYALGRVPNPPPVSGLQPIDPSVVSRPDLGSWTAVGTVLQGADGSQVPAIVVTGQITDPNVTAVLVEYRLQLSPGVFGDWVSTSHPQTTRRVELRAVQPGGTYNVRVRYRSVRQVEGVDALDLGLVTVGSLVSGGVTQIGGMTPQDLIDELNDLTNATEHFAEQYVLAVGTPPHVAGMRIASPTGGPVSSIAFLADQIGFTNGTDPDVYPLAVSGGIVHATNFEADRVTANAIKAGMIDANTITADKIVSGSVSIGTSQLSQASTPLVNSGWTVVSEMWAQHYGHPTTGAARPVDILVYANTVFGEETGVGYNLKVYNSGGALVAAFPAFVTEAGLRVALRPFINSVFVGRWTPLPGAYRYSLEGLNGGGATMSNNYAFINVTEQRTQG